MTTRTKSRIKHSEKRDGTRFAFIAIKMLWMRFLRNQSVTSTNIAEQHHIPI